MLESWLAAQLNKYLFKYVENLDGNQLKVSVWGGDIVLNNLKIKENALDDLDLPVQLVSGFLGKFVLKIPWKSLYSQPVVAQIEDLFLLVAPKQSVAYDAEKEDRNELERKQKALQELEEAFLKEMDSATKADPGYVERLVARVVNNVQVKIANVHIRYEDTSKAGIPYAFGITLHDFEVFTTDDNWEKCFVDSVISHVYKLANLECLSVYMNCNTESYSTRSEQDILHLFRSNIASKEHSTNTYSYLLGPISSKAKLLLNQDPNQDSPPFSIPKEDLSLNMEKLNIGITSTQFQIIMGLLDDMNRLTLSVPYRKYRPYGISYKGNARKWWQFCITAVLEEQIRKRRREWTWEYMREHRRACKTYSESYKERCLAKKPSSTLVAMCDYAEQKLDLFNLKLIRKQIHLEVERQRKHKETTKSTSWFGSWFSSKPSSEGDAADLASTIQAAMTPEEKKKLHKAIGYDDNVAPIQLPEHYEARHMKFTLEALEIGLYDDSEDQKKHKAAGSPVNLQSLKTLMLLKFNMTSCTIKQRPAANAMLLKAGMKEMILTGSGENDGIAPIIIESKITHENNLLDILFETNPMDKSCDQRVKVLTRPLQIVYDAETIIKLKKVFVPQQQVNLSELEGAATLKISDFKERSATGMQYMIESHAKMDLDITFMPNVLILPQGGKYKATGDQSLIIVGLGQLRISSTNKLASHDVSDISSMFESGKGQEQIMQSVMDKAYDRYNVSVENIQVLVAKPKENWEMILNKSTESELHLLRPTSLIVDAQVCVVDDDPRMPKTKVEILLPSIRLNLTDDRVFEALAVALSVPLPESDGPIEPPPVPTLTKARSSATLRRSMPQFLNQDERRKTLSAAGSMTTEVIQYTSLEVHFALKEFGITLVRTTGDRRLSAQGSEEETTSEFTTPTQQLSPSDSEFLDVMSGISVVESQKLLAFEILQLEVFMAQRTFEMVATAKLGAISLLSYEHQNAKEQELVVIETPGYTKDGKALLTVAYTNVDKTTPDFITKYKSIEQLAQINFATLNVILHQENILQMMEIANQLQRKIETMTQSSAKPQDQQDRMASAAAGEGVIHKLERIAEEAEFHKLSGSPSASPVQTLQKKTRKTTVAKVVESIKMKIEANLDQVGLELTCRKRSLALLRIQHLYAGVILKSSYTEVEIGLKDIIIIDKNPTNIHSDFLSIVGKDALRCNLVMYNLDETKNYNSDDMKVDVEIGCMKIIFVNWFLNSVMSFLNHFQAAQQAIADAGAKAADAAKQNAVAVYEKATRMKLNIKIKAPVIIVPIDSQSREGIALDLGQLSLTNTITDIKTSKSDHGPAVLDEIRLVLKDMQLSKVHIFEADSDHDLSSHELDTVDSNMGFRSKLNILDPASFTLNVKRNLSFTWYRDLPEIDISGRLKSIELNLFMDDYALIMSILNRNLKEGLNEFPQLDEVAPAAPPPPARVSTPNKTPLESPVHKASSQLKEKMRLKKEQQDKVSEQFKFNLQFDGVILNLMTGIDEGLARFGFYVLSLKGSKLIDQTLTTNIVLCNIQLEDTRPNNTSQITKYLCRKDWFHSELEEHISCFETENTQKCARDMQYMLDLTAVIKENDTVANVRISSFDLILCVDFLLKLTQFLKLPEDAEPVAAATPAIKAPPPAATIPQADSAQLRSVSTVAMALRPPSQTAVAAAVNKINLTLVVDEPDIILVETLTDMNTSAIIFNLQAKLIYRQVGEKQLINGNIKGLKMYMCAFEPERREATRHYILHPCEITLHGNTPEEDGMKISLKSSEIIINISPATLELFNKAMQSINTAAIDETQIRKDADYTDIWIPKKYKEKDFWFLRVDPAQDALTYEEEAETLVPVISKTENCIIEMPSLMLVLEAGVGYYTTPLISLDTSLNAVVNNWSSNLSVNGGLTLTMNYYNQSLAVWEPVIEQNEHLSKEGERTNRPWELNFSMIMDQRQSEFDENKTETCSQIKIQSDENLEMTVTKTFLDLTTSLQEAFGQAMDPQGLLKPDVIAPYVLENDTGFDISLDFTTGIFTLHECHMPNSATSSSVNRGAIVFKNDIESDVSPEAIKFCTISAGCKAYLQTKSLASVTCEEDEEYNIYLSVGHIDKRLVLPVSKSDKRYFPLYRDINQDPWGIVSEVNAEYGTTTINVHSVVNIENHFTCTVKIYRMKTGSREMIEVGKVGPGEIYHIPLHAIYSEAKTLHFAIEDYRVSVQGIKWDDCPTDMDYMRHLQCDPIETFEPFFINVSREKTEIYHEHTNKFKLLSAYYTLHLRPPVYLRNSLPINITVSVAGCSVRENANGNAAMEIQEEDKENSSTEIDANKQKHHQSDNTFIKEDLLDYGEKDIKAGSVLHLPTVKLSGRGKAKSYLVVRLLQYLERDWSCTTEISEKPNEIANWKFNSYDSDAKMSMDLCVRLDDRNGSLLITLFSPFWLINKTGQMLSYKTDSESVEVLYHPPEYTGPILFSFREKHLFDKKSCSIRVENGEWSNKIPLDVAGSTGSVTCKTKNQIYQIGVHNHLTMNSLTKQITFIPFYTITNKCDFDIEVQEASRPADPWIKLEPNGCFPLWPINDSDHKLMAKVDGQPAVPFKYSEPTNLLLQLDKNKHGGINVDVQTTEGGNYITFTEYNPGDAPGLLINHTTQPVVYYEKGVDNQMVLLPNQRVLFTWSNPTGDRILVFGKKSKENDLRRDDVGDMLLDDNTKAYWVTFLDGLQRVLLFTSCEEIATKSETSAALQTITQAIEVKIHGIGLSVINNETGVDIMYLGITSSGIIWEYKKQTKKRFKQMNLHETALIEGFYQDYLLNKGVEGISKNYMLEGKHKIDFDDMIMLKNNQKRDLLRTFLPGVWIAMNSSPFQSQIHAKINRIQLDNQLTDCIFPVVMAPIPPPKTLAKTTHYKPFVEVSIVQRIVPHSSVKQYKYAKMLMQEFHFKVDLFFLMAVADLFAAGADDEREAKLFQGDVDAIARPLSDLIQIHTLQEQKNFYDNLHLGPMKVHLSFSMAGMEPSALPGILAKLVQGVGVTIADVNDVVIRLAFFEREYQFFTQQQLVSEISSHYTGQALKQIYVLVLGLDVLGNPYGLVVGIKKGVEDLFYEPFQGAIQGPGEFAEGLVLGVKSLFGHTVGGAAGAVSKITGAMGKGLAVLTFDEDYQRKRRQTMNAKPKTFQEGMARSGKGLVMGFVDGVTGCVTKPINGAKEEGVEGFFKGLGKGTIGLVTRPTAGIVDFAHGTFDSVKRATEMQSDSRRLRPPRYVHGDKILRPYCLDEAKGNQLLKEMEKGKYASTDSFVHCEEIVTKQEYVVVSNHRVIYVTRNDMFGTWNVQWTYLWNEITKVSNTDRGVEITLKKEGKKVMGLFSSNEPQHKVILMPLKRRRELLLEAIESQRLST